MIWASTLAQHVFGFWTVSVSKMFISPREVVPSNVVNDQDQGGLIAIAAALSLLITGMFFCIRLFIRWPWQKLFRTDDSVALIASVREMSLPHCVTTRLITRQMFCIIHSIIVLVMTATGLGKQSMGLTTENTLAIRKVNIYH